jgi:hypothetical protein
LKKIFITTLILIASITKAQNWEWVKLIQPNDNKSYMLGMADLNGNVYGGGFFNQSINLGNSQALNGNWDGFISKFDTAGLCQWAQKIYVTTQGCGCTVNGNRSSAYVAGFDNSGNVIVYGGFCGCNEAFGSGITASVTGYNIFIAKYNSSGVCQWVKTKPGSFNSSTGDTYDAIYAVTIDKSDNIYLSMFNYATSTTFCGLNFTTQNNYLVKVNTNGVGIWSKQISSGSGANGYGVPNIQYYNKRMYASIQFNGTATLGTNTVTSQGSTDVAVLKMDTAGNVLASSVCKTTGTDVALGLATSKNRIVLMAQSGANTITVGTNTLNTNGSKDKTFLVAYDTTSLTVQTYTNTANDSLGTGTNVYSDFKGNLYVTATNSGTTGYGNLSSVGAGRHVIRMDNTLTNYWYSQNVRNSVMPDTLGNIYILDAFTTSANYGSSLSETAANGITLGKIHNAWSTGTGGARMAQTNTMQVYPNPSGGLFNLQLGTNVKHNNAKITLYDISGRLIADNIPFTKQDENTLQIDLTKYVEGSYIIKAEVDNVLYSAKLER